MNSKIDWYREVLALEPGSRVFYPLAGLLRDAGREDEAAGTLRAGLIHHPDHLEAKFLLAELLAEHGGDAAELDATLESLIGVLSRYPTFWSLFADKVAGSSPDCALAVRMLAAHLAGARVDFAGLMTLGLAAAGATTSPTAKAVPILAETPAEAETEASPPKLRGAAEVRELLGQAQPEPAAEPAEASAGPFSGVRTKTMAEVLAGQGDVKGALDIYEELLETATPAQKPALTARMGELKQRLNPAATPEDSAPDKNKLVSVLSMLAGRLEARAAG